ncbi:MAG: flagellin, partial [Clostridiaceae bacterium]
SLTTDAATLANSVNTTFEIENDEVDNSLSMQIGANKGQSFSVDISDMRSKALGISGDTASATADGVGTTAAGAKFVATENVSNGTDSAAVEFALDVSDHTNATAAVEVISQAIERVSSERSKLGAFQNRLEHTIANLGTSSENLTAAESRIRDVDMAKEMMSFSKNNILSQAAQAMLAQANQQPQGVLQLLR